MRNKYGKQCCYCGCYVSAGEGRCWRWDETNRWYVACEDCFQEKKEERRNQGQHEGETRAPLFFCLST